MNRLLTLLAAIPVALCLTKPSDEVVVVAEVTRNPNTVGVSCAELLHEWAEETITREDNSELIVVENSAEQFEVVVPEETFAEETFMEDFFVEETVVIEEIQVQKEITEPTEESVESDKVSYHTGVLTARKGYITDSPCGGSETWYPDAPVGAVKILENLYGFSNLEMKVREDGVRVLSGTMPNGEDFYDLVVVAADVRDDNWKFQRNLNGTFARGELVETSLGPGIVVDYCLSAVNERKTTGHIHIDIATNWN